MGDDIPAKAGSSMVSAQQVAEYLIAHDYQLAALELLVESQEAGKHDEFPQLSAYFKDPSKFPIDEVSKYAGSNALDHQALAADREQKMQLLEYELRVAREDLANLNRRMSSHSVASQPATPTALQRTHSASAGGARQLLPDIPGAASQMHTPSTSVQQQPEAHIEKSGSDQGTALTDVDWSKLGQPSDEDQQELISSIISYCLSLGLRTSAMTMREEAMDMLPPHTAHALAKSPSMNIRSSTPGDIEDGLTLWRWFKLAKTAAAAQALNTRQEMESLRSQVQELQSSLTAAQQECQAAQAAAKEAQEQLSTLQQKLDSIKQLPGRQSATSLARVASLNSVRSAQTATAAAAAVAAAQDGQSQVHELVDSSEYGQMPGAHASIVRQLQELLPRIMPNLTIKTRLEILPMVQAVILAAQDHDTQRVLTGLVFHGVATPDPVQRHSVVALCAGVAAALGPSWAAQELLTTCCKQVASPSAERRVLVAEMMSALLNPASVHTTSFQLQNSRLEPSDSVPLISSQSVGTGSPTKASARAAVKVLRPVRSFAARVSNPQMEITFMGNANANNGSSKNGAASGNGARATAGSVGVGDGFDVGVEDLSELPDAPLFDCTAHAQALLPALTKLAEDRMEQVREAAVVTITSALLPGRLPYTKQHYSVIEDILLSLACDSDSVSGAALDVLLPAVQAWVPSTDILANSLIPRIISEVSRLSKDAAATFGGMAGASTASHTQSPQPIGGSQLPGTFTGSTLSYASAPPTPSSLLATPPGSAGAASNPMGLPPRPGVAGSALGSGHVGRAVYIGASLGFNNKDFACWEHQAMHRLLELYCPLLPALRVSALQAVPTWVVAATVSGGADQDGAAVADAITKLLSARASLSNVSAGGAVDGVAGNGHTIPDPNADPDVHDLGKHLTSMLQGTASSAGNRATDAHPITTGTPRRVSDADGVAANNGTTPIADTAQMGGRISGSGCSDQTFIVHPELPSGEIFGSASQGNASMIGSVLSAVTATADGQLLANVLDSVQSGDLDPAALFAAWATSEKSKQWKRMQWVLQTMIPELIEVAKCLGVPSKPAAPLSGSAAGLEGVAAVTPQGSCWAVHEQLARTVSNVAVTFGSGWTRAVLLPMYCSASGCMSPGLYPPAITCGAVLEAADQMVPQTPHALTVGRTCILPHMLAAVLPYCPPQCLSDFTLSLTELSRELPASFQSTLPAFFGLLQHPSVMAQPGWLPTAQQQFSAAISFACHLNAPVVFRWLQVLESLVKFRKTSLGPTGANPTSHSPTPSGNVGGLSGLTSSVALSIALGLVPLIAAGTASSTAEADTYGDTLPGHAAGDVLHHRHSYNSARGSMSGIPPLPEASAVTTNADMDSSTSTPPRSSRGALSVLVEARGAGATRASPEPTNAATTYDGMLAGTAVAAAMDSAAIGRKVMSLVMMMLSEGDLETQAGVVGVLLDLLLRCTAAGREDTKMSEQVCMVFDNLLASGTPQLVATVLSAAQKLATNVSILAVKSALAAQLVEWVLGVVHTLGSQLLPIVTQAAAMAAATPQAQGNSSSQIVIQATDQQRHMACQLLNVLHAVFMGEVKLPGLTSSFQACLDTLVKIRPLLPEQYAAVLTPMQAGNRPAAATAMANAQAAAAAFSAVANPGAAGGGWAAGPGAKMGGSNMHSLPSLQLPGSAPETHNLSPQQQQYWQQQQQQQAQNRASSVSPHQHAQQQQLGARAMPSASGPTAAAATTAQAMHAAASEALTARWEQIRSRFRKKNSDGEPES